MKCINGFTEITVALEWVDVPQTIKDQISVMYKIIDKKSDFTQFQLNFKVQEIPTDNGNEYWIDVWSVITGCYTDKTTGEIVDCGETDIQLLDLSEEVATQLYEEAIKHIYAETKKYFACKGNN